MGLATFQGDFQAYDIVSVSFAAKSPKVSSIRGSNRKQLATNQFTKSPSDPKNIQFHVCGKEEFGLDF